MSDDRHQQIDVLIVAATKEEVDTIRKVEPDLKEERDIKGFPYYVKEIADEKGYRFSIALARPIYIGGDFASNLATRLVNELEPRCLALVGTCAGWRGKVFLGDVVVADRVFRYDSGKLVAYQKRRTRVEEVFQDIKTYNLDPRWLQKAQDFPLDWISSINSRRPIWLVYQEWWLLHKLSDFETDGDGDPLTEPDRKEHCPDWSHVLDRLGKKEYITISGGLKLTETGRQAVAEQKTRYPDGYKESTDEGKPIVHVRPVATGGQVKEDLEIFPTIARYERKVLALEMEGAAIGTVAEVEDVEYCIIVKGVSDFADPDKDDHFQEYAIEASYRFLIAFLKDELSQKTKSEFRHVSPETAVLEAKDNIRQTTRLATQPANPNNLVALDTRLDEIVDVEKQLAASPVPVSCLWITGQPGCGKTFFAFKSAKHISGRDCVYIPEGAETDAIKFTECIRQTIPDEYLKTLTNNRIQSPNDLSENEFVEVGIMAINMSDRIVVVEAAHESTGAIDGPILQELLRSVQYSQNLKLILTTYSVSAKRIAANHLAYALPKLSYDDAHRIMLYFRGMLVDEQSGIVYSEFDGHALSIVSWAASGEPVDSGLPAQTVDRFRLIWSNLTKDSQELFAALCNEPGLARRYLLEDEATDILLSSGLLSRYPSVERNGIDFYIHQVAKDACQDLFSHEKQIQVTMELLEKVVDRNQELTWAGPRLTEYLLRTNQSDKAGRLLLTYGREWLESSGLRTTQEFLVNVQTRLNRGSRQSFFCRYLRCLAYLFSGKYHEAMTQLRLLAEEDVPTCCVLATKFEIAECLRRLGDLVSAVRHFSEIYDILKSQDISKDKFESHFQGVSFFVSGHLFRHVGKFREAYEAYDMSEKCLLDDTDQHDKVNMTANNRVEALHCAYAKSQCFFVPEIQLNDNVSYEHLIEDTHSSFLQGLFHITQTRFYAVRGDYRAAELEIQKAKSAFRDFGSVMYYQRSCCFEALIADVLGDSEGVQLALNEIPAGKEASTKVAILKRTLSLVNGHGEDIPKSLSESVTELLQSGNTLAVFSLLCLLKEHQIDYPSVDIPFKITGMVKTAESKWELHTDIHESLEDFESSVMQEYNIDTIQPIIFLFD